MRYVDNETSTEYIYRIHPQTTHGQRDLLQVEVAARRARTEAELDALAEKDPKLRPWRMREKVLAEVTRFT